LLPIYRLEGFARRKKIGSSLATMTRRLREHSPLGGSSLALLLPQSFSAQLRLRENKLCG